MKVDLTRHARVTSETETVEGIEVPALPRVGDYVSHEPSGIQGTVAGVQFWWPEDGAPLLIEVQLK